MSNEEKLVLSDDEWRRRLSREQYQVCRGKATEPPFTGAYWNCQRDGVYICACCGQELFGSEAKFASRSGWPSFHSPLADERVATAADASLGMRRTEVLCGRCDAHLGHLFPDGPAPTGLRYCVNSAALKLVPRD